MKRRGPTTGRPTPRQRAWWSSARFREIGRRTCQRINARRRDAVKCGATKKSDGEPCQNLPLANGRCRFHGGRTPSGKAWHVVQYPPSDTPARAAKSDRKAADVVKRARKLARRLTAMSAEERARYEAWRRAHAPGPPAARSAARRTAAQNQATRELLARPDAPRPRDADIAEVEMFLAQMKREQAAAERAGPLNDDGVFG